MTDYQLILIPLHKDWKDLNGVIFLKGNVISDNFVKDKDITNGLMGFKWGYTSQRLVNGFGDNFAVAKVSEDVIVLDDTFNVVKFSSCYVLLRSTFKNCIDFIRADKCLPEVLKMKSGSETSETSLQKTTDYFIAVEDETQ